MHSLRNRNIYHTCHAYTKLTCAKNNVNFTKFPRPAFSIFLLLFPIEENSLVELKTHLGVFLFLSSTLGY